MSDLLLKASLKANMTKDRAVNKVNDALASERGNLIEWILVIVFVVGLISLVFIKFILPAVTDQADKTSKCIETASKGICSGFSQ